MLDRIIVVLTIIAVYYLITQSTEEGYYYGQDYVPTTKLLPALNPTGVRASQSELRGGSGPALRASQSELRGGSGPALRASQSELRGGSGPAYNPVRGYFRDYFPRVGTGISSYGLVPPGILAGMSPDTFTVPRDDFSGFPYQDATNYSAGFGPYRLPYLNNRLLFWNKVADQYPNGRIPNAVPFYRVPINTS